MTIRRPTPALVAALAGLALTLVPGAASSAPPSLPELRVDPPGLTSRPDHAPAARTADPPGPARRPAGRIPATTVGSTYTDTCHDATGGAFDLRRMTVAVNDTSATFTATFCGVRTPEQLDGLGDRLLRWRTVAGDAAPGTVRHLDLEQEADGFRLTVYTPAANGEPATVHETQTGIDPVVPAGGGTPVPHLSVTIDRSSLRLRPNCDPSLQAGCLFVAAASFPAEGDAGDVLPEPGSTRPLRWPSDCNADLTPDRAVVRTADGAAGRVAAALREAGYPASTRGRSAVDVHAGVTAEVRAALDGLDGVRTVADPQHKHPDAVVPDDDLYPDQWSLQRLRVPSAWETSTGTDEIRIGILDDGVDATRSEFGAGVRVAAGWDAVRASDFDDPTGPEAAAAATIPAGTDSDLGFHGTAVAALAAGAGDDGAGIAGVDWNATVVPIRVMDHEGCISEAAYLEGLRWARDEGRLDVVNVSLGGAEIPGLDGTPGEADYVRDLFDAGTLTVASMGNEGERAGIYRSFPAALPEVLAVGATTADDRVAGYSNFGRHVDVVAPGGNQAGTLDQDVVTAIDPTLDRPAVVTDEGGAYGPLAGTSFATPLVSGLASLYLAVHAPQDPTPADVVRALLDTARDLGGTGQSGFDLATGFGMPRANDLLAAPTGRLTARLAGTDRYATAVAAALRAFPDPALVDTVLLSTGTAFPDALAGGPLAAREHAPLLLSTPDVVPAVTMQALDEFDPDRVLLLGGPSALDDGIRAQLQEAGHAVDRVAGADRYDTAARVAAGNDYAYTGAPGEPVPAPTTWDYWSLSDVVYVATGENFPDALAGGAAAAANGAPMLLSPRAGLAESTRIALERLAPSQVVVLGGTGALSEQVVAQIEALPSVTKVVRAAGSDRYGTAVAAACPSALLCIRDTRHVVVATATGFADALGGTAAAAALRAPLLLVPPDGPVPGTTLAALDALAPERAFVLGGGAAVADGVEAAVGARVVR